MTPDGCCWKGGVDVLLLLLFLAPPEDEADGTVNAAVFVAGDDAIPGRLGDRRTGEREVVATVAGEPPDT